MSRSLGISLVGVNISCHRWHSPNSSDDMTPGVVSEEEHIGLEEGETE
jgi:hypothetical protein